MVIIMDKKLDLDDRVRIVGIEALKADVNLDKEQIGWLSQIYQSISSYKDNYVIIREIDSMFALVGECENFPIPRNHVGELAGDKLLSIRRIKLSEENKKAVAEYERKQESAPPGVCFWRPVVGDKRLYFAASENNQLFFGLYDYLTIDGYDEPTGFDYYLPLARIQCEK